MREELDEEETIALVARVIVEIAADQERLASQVTTVDSAAKKQQLNRVINNMSTPEEVAKRSGLMVGIVEMILREHLGVQFVLNGMFTISPSQFRRIESIATVKLVRRAHPGVLNNTVNVHGSGHQVAAGGNVFGPPVTHHQALTSLQRAIALSDLPAANKSKASLFLQSAVEELNQEVLLGAVRLEVADG